MMDALTVDKKTEIDRRANLEIPARHPVDERATRRVSR